MPKKKKKKILSIQDNYGGLKVDYRKRFWLLLYKEQK